MRRAVLLAISLAVSLVAVELGLRLFLGPYYAAVYRVNDVWLWEHVPGVHRVNTRIGPDGRERIAFDVNADGFRGPELRPAGAATRVVVYGDSFIAARATRLEETFVARLGERLRGALGVDVEAVNAGVVGYGPDQVCLRMEAEFARLRPDLVVVAVTAENDYGDNVRNRLFEIAPEGGVRRHAPTIPQGMRDAYAAAQSGWLLAKTLRMATERLRAPTAAPTYGVDEELAACAQDHGRAVIDRWDEVIVGVDHPDADVRVAPASGTARYKVALMAGVLAAVRDAARANGVPLLLVVIPSAADVCRRYDRDAVNTSEYPDYRPDNLTRPIDGIADSLNVAYVDLFPAFSAADADALYFRGGDTHWNAAGQSLAAELAAPAAASRLRGR